MDRAFKASRNIIYSNRNQLQRSSNSLLRNLAKMSSRKQLLSSFMDNRSSNSLMKYQTKDFCSSSSTNIMSYCPSLFLLLKPRLLTSTFWIWKGRLWISMSSVSSMRTGYAQVLNRESCREGKLRSRRSSQV